MSLGIERLIKEIEQIEPPDIFVNYHKKYLDKFNLMKAIFEESKKSNALTYQSKVNELESMNTELTKELELILEKKKNEQ
jgi:hypothetical protein